MGQLFLRAHVPACLACLCDHVHANVNWVLACLMSHHALCGYVPHVSSCLACLGTDMSRYLASSRVDFPRCFECLAFQGLRDYVVIYQHALPAFSVSLPFLLNLYTLLIRFENLIKVFPQELEFIFNPRLLIIFRLNSRVC